MPGRFVLGAPLIAALLSAASALFPVSHAAAQASGEIGAAADAQTTAIVAAADAFLSTLSDAEKSAVRFDFTDAAQRTRWSNLPDGIFARKGMAWGDMNEAQRIALVGLLDAVLGSDGMENVREQMAADDALPPPGDGPGNGGPGNGGPSGDEAPADRPSVRFGGDYYYVALLGAPSATSPWMLQFGGHHLGINATIVGPNLTLSPTLTGGQPLKFMLGDRPVYIVVEEAVQGAALLMSLTEAQREKAVIGREHIDLVLGAGKDGMVLQPEGLSAAEMDVQQKAQFLELIEARLAIIMNAEDRAVKMAEVRKNLDQTYFAWWGPPSPLGAAYWRVTGPTLLLEFSPQALGGDPTQHAHNIYRDPTNEYGAAWTPLK